MRCKQHARGTRRGIGALFLVAIGILVVLVVLLFAQARTQDATGREINVVALGGRATVAAESALTELAYRLDAAAAGEDREAPAHRALRGYLPGVGGSGGPAALLEGAPPYLETLELEPSLTAEAYAEEEDVEIGERKVGVTARVGFPGEEDLATRDHRGLVALEQVVTLTPPWGGAAVSVTARGVRAFRSLLVDVPPPFSQYTAVVLETPDDGNRFRAYWEAYRQFENGYTGNPDLLPDFPVAGIEGSVGGFFVTTMPEVPSAGWSVDPLLPNPQNLGVTERDDWADAFAAMQPAGWERLTEDAAAELEAHLPLLGAGALGARSTFRVDSMADLAGYFGDGDTLELRGVVQVSGSVILDHVVSGTAVLWTDDPGGVTVRRLERSSISDRLLLVSTKGDVRIELGSGGILPASLAAPQGTVTGLDGVTVQGRMVLGRYPPDLSQGPDQRREGPAIPAPEPGQGLPDEGRAATRVVFDPGFVRRDFRRQRIRDPEGSAE